LTEFDLVFVFRFTYEIAPVFVLMEQLTLKKMREMIGWPNGDGDGLFSPGKQSKLLNITITNVVYSPKTYNKTIRLCIKIGRLMMKL